MLWGVRVIIVTIEMQQYVHFYWCSSNVADNNIKVFSVATEMQHWVSLHC
jgi:hypothetical protein